MKIVAAKKILKTNEQLAGENGIRPTNSETLALNVFGTPGLAARHAELLVRAASK